MSHGLLCALSSGPCLKCRRQQGEKYPALPILYAGGVMRNAAIRSAVAEAFSNVWFAEPSLSSDNAVGTAYLGLAKRKRERG